MLNLARKGVRMAATQNRCPNCHQLVPAEAHSCPHCGVYLQLPAHAHPQQENAQGSLLGVARPAPPPSTPKIALEQSLPDAIKQLDTAATTNITISGVLIAFYSGAIFAGKVLASQFFYALVYALPIVLLLIAIILSVRVFYPAGYLTDDHAALLKTKDERLRYSSLLLEISVAMLAISVFVYLLRTGA